MTAPTYGRAFRDFVRWCRNRRLASMPAHPWTVAAYLSWCEHRHPYAAIVKRLKAISRAHVLRCHRVPDRNPTVIRTLREIERRNRTRSDRAALFEETDFLDDEAEDKASENREKTPASRRQIMRSKPRLVHRRPRRKGPVRKKSPSQKKK